MTEIDRNSAKKEAAEMYVSAFVTGAITLASLHLGFELDEPLTESQAKEFHRFVVPIMTQYYAQIKEDKEKVRSFQDFYQNSHPIELLTFFLKEKVLLG